MLILGKEVQYPLKYDTGSRDQINCVCYIVDSLFTTDYPFLIGLLCWIKRGKIAAVFVLFLSHNASESD